MQDKSELARRLTDLGPEKRELLKKLLESKAGAVKHIPKRRAGDRIPLSFSQQRLWIVDQLLEGKTAYSQTNFIRFQSGLDLQSLRRGINDIIHRHEILRTTFHSSGGEPFQQVTDSLVVDIPLVDLRHIEPSKREAEALRLIAQDAEIPFSLDAGPLIRGAVYRIDERDHLFALTLHHMVCDGWSMGVFSLELSVLYWSYVLGRQPTLVDLPIQYGDFAVWQRKSFSEDRLNPQLQYWRAQLAGLHNFDLSADRARPAQFTYRGSRVPVVIGGKLLQPLVTLAEQQNVTVHILLLTALFVLMHRYTGEEDMALGVPVAGRTCKELEPLIGFFVNTLVMRADLSSDPTFLDLLARVRQICMAAYANQDVPFERLVDELRPVRDPSRNPLVQIVFQLFQPPISPGVQREHVFPFVPAPSGGSKFDLVFELIGHPEEIRGFAEYNTDLFEENRIRRMIAHFERLLEGIVENPARNISRFEILPADEHRTLVEEWNNTTAPYARDSNLVAELRLEAERAHSSAAVEFCGASLTYGELYRRSMVVAAHLIELGVQPGDCVGLLMERSLELPVAMIGILAAGAFYVPLDPRYPREHMAYLLSDSGAKAVVTNGALEPALAGIAIPSLAVDRLPQREIAANLPAIAPSNTAWLLYTSGTTGKPKGVPVTHRGALRLVRGIDTPVTAADAVLQFASITFDASVFEIWMALLNGAKLVICPPDPPSLDELGAFIRQSNLTWAFLTTSLFRQMIEHNARDLRGLRQLVTGGEALPPGSAQAAWKQLPRTRITNAYGPTECATIATTYTITNIEDIQDAVPIGRPIHNTKIYILDSYGNPAPVGIPGEIYIGGDCVASGYWNRPDLTQRSFVPDPWNPGETLYRTGDIGRRRTGGNIEFLGRKDRQVKVSGYRIELGGVEAALLSHPDVSGAAALVLDQESEGRLVAFAEVVRGRVASSADLRAYLATVLPNHLIPASLETVERLPLAANGKVDLAALARLAASAGQERENCVEPRNAVERVLAGLWKEILHVDRIGITDDFFDLGGQSLVATRLLSRVRDMLQGPVTMRQFFDDPTIRGLGAVLSKEERVVKRAGLLEKINSVGAGSGGAAAAEYDSSAPDALRSAITPK